MSKYAQVVINNNSVELDREFTYSIPQELEDRVFLGSRVLIPFGNRNLKIEGYVTKLLDICDIKNIKSISDCVDPYPIFSEKMLELAKWMKNEYMCTMLDCLKCIAPTGISIKTNKVIHLNKEFDKSELKSDTQKKIIQVLIDNNYEIEFEQLVKIVNSKSINGILTRLETKHIIYIENVLFSTVKDKLMKVACLDIPVEEAKLLCENLSDKYSAQKRVLNILIDNDFIATADLVKFAETSYNAINSLASKGIISFEEIEISRDPYADIKYTTSNPHVLTQEQEIALKHIIHSISNSVADRYLIHGVTGSGKTEVYLQAIDHVINIGGQAIVLVPEISLTPQMVERFKSRFGEEVAVIHSRLSLGERFDQWKKIKNNQVSVVVGARSAVFAPFENLKLIIIDEEHEGSYKSENKPKYHAKKIAEKRSELENCVVVLGSATPSVETYYQAQNNEYKLAKMNTRANKCVMPKVDILDMRVELEEGNRSIFSRQLHAQIEENIKKGEQTILFLNRRGYSTFVSCRQCGIALKCPHCSIALTYHSYNNVLICHYCGHTERNPSVCPSCKSKYIKYFGIGTQKIEEEIRKTFPQASVLRMDMDTTGTKFSHQNILDKFKNDNVNILIGTQMIAKGLDFPNVTLVGVISADTSLNIDDFRASERTFQLLTQVAGRSGRGEKEGRVIIQTYQPDEFSILTAKEHDYESFYQNEILMRKNLLYPPFTDIASIIISDSDNNNAKQAAKEIEKILGDKLNSSYNDFFEIYSPTLAPLSKIKQMYRWRLIIKANKNEILKNILREIELLYYNKVNISIDVNATNML